MSHHEVVRDTTESGLRRMIGALAVIMPSAALIQVLANLGDYRQPAVAVAVWLAMFPAAFWLVPRIRAGGLSRGEAAAAILIALTAVAVIGWQHHAHDSAGSVDLAVLGTAWLPALVALSRPAWAWVPGALVIFAVHALLLVRDVGASPLNLAQLEAAGYILVVILVAFAALRPTLAVHTSMAARRALLASRSATKQAAAAAVLEDRQHRLARLEVEALPLLRSIAEGALDPTAPDVRERCARHAAVLRHSLTGRAPGTAGLVAGLQPALRAASARGLLVNLQVIGDPGNPAPDVAGAVLATVDAVISALPPQQVVLTVLGSGDDVELYLTFTEPLPVPSDLARFAPGRSAAVRWHAALTADQTGTGCLEISWRKGGAA